MGNLNQSATAAYLQQMIVKPETRRIASYWLSLWEGNALPWRRSFEPVRVRDLLPGVMIMEVDATERIIARLSGKAINKAFGADLTGRDLVALTPPEQREARLARNAHIVCGETFALATRRGRYGSGEPWESEDIQLPFRDVTDCGARLALFHTTLRPTERALMGGLELAEQWRTFALDGTCSTSDFRPTF